jgi:hypothetical protein
MPDSAGGRHRADDRDNAPLTAPVMAAGARR